MNNVISEFNIIMEKIGNDNNYKKSKKNCLKSLRVNLITNCLTFLTENELFNIITRTSKVLMKALKKEHLWQNLILRKELFVQKDLITSWRKHYLEIRKLEKNWKNGRPNVSFKMFPCRDHKQPITSLLAFSVIVDNEKIKDNEEENGQKKSNNSLL